MDVNLAPQPLATQPLSMLEDIEPHASFVCKVSAIRTRTRDNKDYFAFRAYIPKDAAEKLELKNGDYIFATAEKAKWYHMLEWKEMPKTWNMLPPELKMEILVSGIESPAEAQWANSFSAPTYTMISSNVFYLSQTTTSPVASTPIVTPPIHVPSGRRA